jgi:hypothetical protein
MSVSLLLLLCLLPGTQLGRDRVTFEKVIGRQNVKKIVIETLEQKVKKYSERGYKLEYSDDFASAATDGILDSEVPPDATPSQAVSRLREGFGRFVDNIVEFAREKKSSLDRVIRFTTDLYDQYMHRPPELQKCGEVPCNRPPCCRYCDPPPCKPGEKPLAQHLQPAA